MKVSDPIVLQPANTEDVEAIALLIRGLSAWLRGKGVHQWSDSFPTELLEHEIETGELYVCRENGEIIASVALTHQSGELWDFSADSAIYLHRLAVSRKRSGKRFGQSIMAWAENEAQKRGVPALRLECDLQNSFLQSYYTSLGYQPKGVKHYSPYNMDFARFEKTLKR